MESKTLAVFDSTLWFIRVGVAIALFAGTLAGTAFGQSDTPYPHLTAATPLKVQLVRKLPDRKGRRIAIGGEQAGVVGNE